MVPNPKAVRRFAEALMKRSKNDRIDAEVLLEYAAQMPFRPGQAPGPVALQLHAIARRIEALTELRTAEMNRLHAAHAAEAIPVVIRRDLQRSIRYYGRAIERLKWQALKLIASDPPLQRRFELLLSITGMVQTTAIQNLAELAVLSGSAGPAVGGPRRSRPAAVFLGHLGAEADPHQQGGQPSPAPRPLHAGFGGGAL